MKRALLAVLVVAVAVSAVLLLRQGQGGDEPARAPQPGGTTAAPDPAALQATGAATGATKETTTAAGTRTVAGARAIHLTIRGHFEADPRLPLADAVVRVVDRDLLRSRQSSAGPWGFGFGGIVPLDPKAQERGRAPVQADGSFVIEVREVGQTPSLTVQLDHDHYFLANSPKIAISDGAAHDLGSLRPILGALVTGRLVGFDDPAATDIFLVTELDMMAPARDPQLFAAQMATTLRPSSRAQADGQFRLRGVGPNPGTDVRAERGDQIGTSAHFALSPGETREVTVHARPAATVAVRVRDGEGAAVAGASVAVSATAGAMTGRNTAGRSGKTDAEGRVRLRGLVAGEVRIAIAGTDFAAVREKRTLQPGEQEFAFTLDLGAAVLGSVEDDTGQKVAGARIVAQASMSVPMFGDTTSMVGADALADAADDARCRSDADGKFKLGGLPRDGTVTLIVAHDDYAPKTESSVKPGGKEVRVVLQRPADVVGRVLDGATGKPLPAFDVDVVSTAMMGMEMPVKSEQVRGAEDGRFALRLSPVRVGLRFSAPGFGINDQKIQPASGQRLDLGDVTMAAAASVAGRVVDDAGRPLPSARVRIRRGGMMDHPMFAAVSNAPSATTDAGGEFVLPDVTPGKVRLMATHRDFATGESTRLEVAPGQAHRDALLTLDHGGTIEGRLLLAPGVRVADWDVYAGETRGGSVHVAQLDGDGKYRVSNLAPGSYQVQAMNSAGFASTMAESGMGDSEAPDIGKMMKGIARHLVQALCQVRKGEVTAVDLDATALEGAGATLQCTVLLGDQPITDSFLEVRGAGEGGRIVAIENGKAEVTGLKPGPVSLQVRTGMGFSTVGEAQTATIERADQEKQFELRLPGSVLAGQVVDADSGEPIRGATVRARRVGEVASAASELGFALTDGSGHFRFRGLAAGTYNVVADELLSSDPTRGSGRIDGLTLGATERRENLVLRARRGAQVSVTVRDGAGNPLRHAMVVIVDADGQPAATLPIAITDAEGRADLAGLPDGPARAVARVSHLAPGFSDLQRATSGRELKLDVVLNPGTAVTLHVEDARGQALPGSRVAVQLGDGPWLSAQLLGIAMSGADIDLGTLPAGRVRLRVDHPTAGTFEAERVVPPGRRATLTATAPR